MRKKWSPMWPALPSIRPTPSIPMFPNPKNFLSSCIQGRVIGPSMHRGHTASVFWQVFFRYRPPVRKFLFFTKFRTWPRMESKESKTAPHLYFHSDHFYLVFNFPFLLSFIPQDFRFQGCSWCLGAAVGLSLRRRGGEVRDSAQTLLPHLPWFSQSFQ